MTPLEMILEWRKGCSVSIFRDCVEAYEGRGELGHSNDPYACRECTLAMIDAIEAYYKKQGAQDDQEHFA